MRLLRARPGAWSHRARLTTTCSTTARCPSRQPRARAERRSPRPCSRSARASSHSASSPPRPAPLARSATTASSARWPRPDARPLPPAVSALAQEALKFPGQGLAGGHLLPRSRLGSFGRLLQTLDERLNVWVALHRAGDLALVVGCR